MPMDDTPMTREAPGDRDAFKKAALALLFAGFPIQPKREHAVETTFSDGSKIQAFLVAADTHVSTPVDKDLSLLTWLIERAVATGKTSVNWRDLLAYPERAPDAVGRLALFQSAQRLSCACVSMVWTGALHPNTRYTMETQSIMEICSFSQGSYHPVSADGTSLRAPNFKFQFGKVFLQSWLGPASNEFQALSFPRVSPV